MTGLASPRWIAEGENLLAGDRSEEVARPELLDLFCCEGGAGTGYDLAGYDVTGVDNRPQPRYPFRFIQADALEVLADREFLTRFDLIHASPPCHDHTPLRSVAGTDGTANLLPAARKLLESSGRPWVIENVPGAPMRRDLILCGHMWTPRLRTRRHRWFEFSLSLWKPPQPPHVHAPGVRTATKQRAERWAQGWDVSVTGDVGTYVGPEAIGADWMTGDGLSQAIPPVYTRYIGEHLIEHLTAERAA